MINYTELLKINPFSFNEKKKNAWFYDKQKFLTKLHYENCLPYKIIIEKLFPKKNNINALKDLPFIPARIFKYSDMQSKPDHEITITLTSSGTSGNNLSTIKLDRQTSLIQSRVLNKIFSTVLPKERCTFFFLDQEPQNKNKTISARTAATRGFSNFVKNKKFLIDQNGQITIKELRDFIIDNPNEPFVVFGFTSLIWTMLISKLKKDNIKFPKNNGLLLHGGGWKKLSDFSVSRLTFNSAISKNLGILRVHNYYGMVEQTGSVFLECEEGFYHSSIFSEILIRNINLDLANINEEGLIQVMSLLPQSYPGHNVLTEDVGKIIGIDGCKCGRKGKYFTVKGRVKGAELRGCSDVY